eukprot:TRINITY_DN3214_c0_g1_i2.p1 TRINITY_DN3214_c0_g1~~TRINITY_DN3214_c0_g1_i2.p1  ORF type:complete len:713 (+),score=141.68 TRINITY_DN3214_c0_g1_i2:93-2141(+)
MRRAGVLLLLGSCWASGLELAVQAGARAAGADGSPSAPFASVQACVDAAVAADTEAVCRVGPGVFREEVVVPGGRAARLSIVGAGGGRTRMTGTTPLPDAWTKHSGSIWKTSVPSNMRFRFQQLFVADDMVFEARWPNTGLSSLTSPHAWAETTNSSYPWTNESGFIAAPELATSGIDWTGALITMNTATRVFSWTRTVAAHKNDTILYDGPLVPFRWKGSMPVNQRKLLQLYWLSGKLEALDSPGEWHLDTDSWELYLWSPDGKAPGSRVSVKTRDLCVDVKGDSAPASVSSMDMHGCTVVLRADGSSASDLNLTYPSYAREVTFREVPRARPPPNVTALFCNDCLIERVHLRYSNIAGIVVVGSRSTVREVLVEDTDWLGSLDFPPIQIGFAHMLCNYTNSSGFDPNACGHLADLESTPNLRHPAGTDNVVTRATVRRFGASGIVTSQLSNEVSYAWLSNGTTIALDNAGIHADNLDAHTDELCRTNNCSKHWHHNWVHDIKCKCVRGDDGSLNITVDHNVIWDCDFESSPRVSGCGIMLKGDNHVIYANTIINASGQGPMVIDTRKGPPCTQEPGGCVRGNNHTQLFNSVFRKLSSKAHGAPVLETLAFYGGNKLLNASELKLRDPQNFDFRPAAGSPLIDAGVGHSPWTSGGRQDVGAYRHDDPSPWRPGCTFSPLCS